MGNIYFEHKSLHKYTREAKGQDGVEVKSMIYLVLVNKDMLHYVQDVREMGRCISDSHVCVKSGWWVHRLIGEM